MPGIAEMLVSLLSRGGQSAAPAAGAIPAPEDPETGLPSTPPVPIRGKFTYGRMPAHVAFTPDELASSMAWERGATNRAELMRAMAAEKRPHVQAILQNEYDSLFGGR